jgi:hypothetical protein
MDAADAIFRGYVDVQGNVDYEGLKANRGDLDAFIRSLADVETSRIAAWPESERIAFWINAYNAITLQRIIDRYPPNDNGSALNPQFPANSIRQIDGVWDRLTTRVAGRDMTLDYIEHEILRKEFQEPRIHAALVCAGKGCPPLRTEAFRGDRLSLQLDDQSRRFLGVPDRFSIDLENKVVRLSSILKWYAADFTGAYAASSSLRGHSAAERAALAYVSQYVSAEDAEFIRTQSYRVEFLDYDWSLNERK